MHTTVPIDIHNSSEIKRTVTRRSCRTSFSTFLIISSFTDIEGRPERGSPLVDAVPRLNSPHQHATVEYGGAFSPHVPRESWETCSVVNFYKHKYLIIGFQLYALLLNRNDNCQINAVTFAPSTITRWFFEGFGKCLSYTWQKLIFWHILYKYAILITFWTSLVYCTPA